MTKRFLSLLLTVLIILSFAGCSTGDKKDGDNSSQSSQASADDSDNNSGKIIVKDMEGNDVWLGDYKGKIIVINFWASWCGPCQAEMPEFDALDKQFKEEGDAVFLAVNLTGGRETKKSAIKFIEDNGYGFKVLFDEEFELATQFGVSPIPHTFIIDREGIIVDSIVGLTNKERVLSIVDQVR